MESFKTPFVAFIRNLQDEICSALENVDGKATFIEELWQREGGGGGRTRVISGGAVFEKGGVNISEVHGVLPDTMQQYLKVPHPNFFACGISLVLHPENPFVPTVHANYRYFELYDSNGEVVDLWFGGGADLTPYYLFEEDAIHFHRIQKEICDQFDPLYYSKYKEACDQYFKNHHRGENRGIGGLFFDYLRATPNRNAQHWFDFTTSVGGVFLDAYLPIIEKRKHITYTPENKYWQEIRRGRYVEFNLIHDKGTLFGLKTNGRIESILMSLPPTVRWDYNYIPMIGTEEEKLLQVLVQPKNWLQT
jgi:coproporphyrinogen III oxidase